MAEIPVERKTKGAFPWWLIPLILLLILLPLLYFTCGRSPAVVDNTNTNRTANAGNTAVVVNNNTNGNNAGVGAFNEEQRIREANERARLAMEKVYPNGTVQQVTEALNLSVVNFAENSAVVPEPNKALLGQAAEMLKKAPAGTRVQLDGYTDNTGNPAANLKLSEQRAQAVRGELIRRGVAPAMLSVKGYGETQPKSSNETPEGRFQNRRIEYTVATGDSNTGEKVAPNGK